MTIIILINCPVGIQGDLTRWLQRFETNVYIGDISARIRDAIWEALKDRIPITGRAHMIHSALECPGYKIRTINGATKYVVIEGHAFRML